MDIRDAIGVSFSWSQFVKEMEKRGYTWKLNRKYPALKTPDMERYVRLRSLGKGYGEAEIREKILRPKIQQVYGKTQVQFPKRKLTGLQKLYFSYLYRMGVLQQKPKRISYAVRSDIRKLDLRIRQMEFLQKEGINTREELAAYRKPLEEQVLSLMKERRTLYRKEPGGMRIQEINGELKELRKKIRLSQQIEIQSKEMEERLKQAKEQEQIVALRPQIAVSGYLESVGSRSGYTLFGKAANISGVDEALAKELAPSNIQVNALACGVIDTDMNRCFPRRNGRRSWKKFRRAVSVRRKKPPPSPVRSWRRRNI